MIVLNWLMDFLQLRMRKELKRSSVYFSTLSIQQIVNNIFYYPIIMKVSHKNTTH